MDKELLQSALICSTAGIAGLRSMWNLKNFLRGESMKATGIRLKEAGGEYDLGVSKFPMRQPFRFLREMNTEKTRFSSAG